MNKVEKFIRLARRGWTLLFDKDYEKLLESEFSIADRVYEYAFIIKNLFSRGRGKIIDIGVVSGVCYLPPVLAEMGFDYHGVDLRDFSFEWPGYTHHVCNILKEKLPFSDSSVDYVLAVSTIEHIGIGAYGESDLNKNGDKFAVTEMSRILKPSGMMLVTVPFAADYVVRPHMRTYDLNRLKWLFEQEKLKLEDIEFWKLTPKNNGNIFKKVTREEAASTKNEKGDATLVIAMVRAMKI